MRTEAAARGCGYSDKAHNNRRCLLCDLKLTFSDELNRIDRRVKKLAEYIDQIGNFKKYRK
jgi:hypothetical protein